MEGTASFRDTRWRRGASLAGLVLLLLYWGGGYFSKSIQSYLPSPIILPLVLLFIHYLFIRFPFAMREPGSPRLIRWPGTKRFFIEFLIAIVMTVLLLIFSAIALSWVNTHFPDSNGFDLNGEIVSGYSRSHAATYALIGFIFLFGPITEEVFFRGFLQNDFQRRMHPLLAAIVQSTFFGMIHPYGIIQNMVLIAIGLTLTAIYKWRGRLLTSILTHCLFNFVVAGSALFMAMEQQNGAYLGVIWNGQHDETVVQSVPTDSPADKAGIEPGDILTSLDDHHLSRQSDVRNLLFTYKPGDKVKIELLRKGETVTLMLELGSRAKLAETTRGVSSQESVSTSAQVPSAR